MENCQSLIPVNSRPAARGQGLPQPDLFAPIKGLDEIATDPLVDQALRDGAWVEFSLSGGKDCGAVSALTMLYLDSIGHPREKRFALHADLGRAEWKSTPAQVQAQADALGVPLVVVRATDDLVSRFENRWERGCNDYADLLLYNLRGPWSSPSLKFCQSEKKIQVMGPYLARTYKGETIIQVVGIRREESSGRKHTPVAKLDTRFAKVGNRAGTRMILWHPGVELRTAEVFAANDRHGIPLAEGYALGATRWSCAYCVMSSEGDLTISASVDGNHDLYRHYVGMEVQSTFSFQAGRWLADIAPQLLDASTIAAVNQAKLYSADRRRMEASMPARHRYIDGWPLHLPTHEEAREIAAVRAVLLERHQLRNYYATGVAVRDRFAELLELKAQKLAA